MPTLLEKTFLAEAIADLDDGQLRKVLRAAGDKAFETVAKEVLSIKGEARKVAPYPPGPEVERPSHCIPGPSRVAAAAPPAGLLHGDVIGLAEHSNVILPILTSCKRLRRSANIAGDLESYTVSSDDDDSSESTSDNGTKAPSRPTSHHRPPLPVLTRREDRLDQLLSGETASRQELLRRLAGIIDLFDWKRQTRKDFLNMYIRKVMSREERRRLIQPAQSWCAIVRIHGERLRRYSPNFALLYPRRVSHKATRSLLPRPLPDHGRPRSGEAQLHGRERSVVPGISTSANSVKEEGGARGRP